MIFSGGIGTLILMIWCALHRAPTDVLIILPNDASGEIVIWHDPDDGARPSREDGKVVYDLTSVADGRFSDISVFHRGHRVFARFEDGRPISGGGSYDPQNSHVIRGMSADDRGRFLFRLFPTPRAKGGPPGGADDQTDGIP